MTTETTSSTTPTTKGPTMAEYAAELEAKLRGKPIPVQQQAATVDTSTTAAATEDDTSTAAATVVQGDDGKTATESATGDDTGAQDDGAQKDGKKGINKRFSEMTAKQKELEALVAKHSAEVETARRETQQALAEAERLRIEAERAQNSIPKVPTAENDPVPNRASFDDPDEYVAAISAHASRQEIRKANLAAHEEGKLRAAEAQKNFENAEKERVQRAISELHANFQKRLAEGKTEYPDFDQKMKDTKTILRDPVFFIIEQSKESPHLMYYLADHPEVADELNKLPTQSEVAVRIGELQAELRVSRKPTVSRAAEPVKPIGNRQSPQSKKPNEMNMDEYAAMLEPTMKKRTRLI